MKIYKLEYKQILPISIDQAWEFFSSPKNLSEITPAKLDMCIKECDSDDIYSGMILHYTVKPILNMRMNWLSEIKHVQKPFMFVDDQKIGPYKLWYHIHRFRRVGQGVEVHDVIYYALPGGILSGLLNGLIVSRKLKHIFDHRTKILDHKFGVYHDYTQ